MLDFLAISLGAVAGANLRYWMSRYALRVLGPVFPYGTLIINVLGSFIVGFFVIWTTERVMVDPRWRLLVVIGFCGGYTTFSSYAFETMSYFQDRAMDLDGHKLPRQQPARLCSSPSRNGPRAGAVEWPAQWQCRSRFT